MQQEERREMDPRRRWDAENMVTIGGRVRREVGDQFRQLTQLAGRTPGAVIRDFVLDYVASRGGDISAQVSARSHQQDQQSAGNTQDEDHPSEANKTT